MAKIETFEDFLAFYQRYGKCPGDISVAKKTLKTAQLQRKYEKFLRREEAQKEKRATPEVDERWASVVEDLKVRDQDRCRLKLVLSPAELAELRERAPKSLLGTLDPAHVMRRNAYPSLYYSLENLVLMNRYSHGLLDDRHHPITGVPLTPEEHRDWWVRIIGEELLSKLEKTPRLEKEIRE